MIHLIDKFETTLSENNGTITVNYRHDILSGFCEYKIVEVNNRFKQKAWVLTNTDMGDVIEYIHSNSPLSDDDLMVVDKLIRDHSLSRVRSLAR
jgi:integrase